MNDILEKYNSSFLDNPLINKNLVFAFGNEQLQEAIKTLGAKDINDVTSVFGVGDVCLKSNAKKIIDISNSLNQEKQNWLKSLNKEEKEIIIKYEINNHECGYTGNIEPVLEILENVFGREAILEVWENIRSC